MGSRIIHFGIDTFNRIRALSKAGYRVDSYDSLAELRRTLSNGPPLAAITIAESDQPAPEAILDLVHSVSTVPVILFRKNARKRKQSGFDLVIPISETPKSWLKGLAALIDSQRRNRPGADTRLAEESKPSSDPFAARSRDAALQNQKSTQKIAKRPEHDRLSETDQDALQSFRTGDFMMSMSKGVMSEFKSIVSLVSFAPETVLFAEGDSPKDVFILLQGDVKIYIDAQNGKRLAVHVAGAGEMLGLGSAFTSKPYRTTAVTLHSSKVASIRCPDFLNFLSNHPKAYQAAARDLGQAFDQACIRLRTIGATPANRAKVARLLLEWSVKGKATERGTQIHLSLKHSEIAECIGTVRESVTRILRDFKRWQIVEHHGSLLTILNRPALEKWASAK